MAEGDFRWWLDTRVQVDAFPALTPAEIDRCAEAAKRADASGLAPGATGWTPTYDEAAAEAAAWEIKAAKVAADFSYSSDGVSVNRSEMFDHFTELADRARHRRGGTISLLAWSPVSDVIGNLNVG